MEQPFRPLVNSGRTGSFVTIKLPGWDAKGETCEIHYEERGEGEALLLLHSPGQSLYTFRELLPLLSRRYRVIAPDWPGSGFSGRPASLSYSVEEMADALLLFMDALGIKQAHAAGASIGALYLVEAAKRAPDRFLRLVLLCPGGVTKTMPAYLRLMAVPVLGPVVRELYGKRSYKKALRTAYFDATACSDRVAGEYYRSADDYASRQALMYALRNVDPDAAYAGADRLQHEIFLLRGKEDRWHGKSTADSALDAMPRAFYYALNSAGHFFWEEKAAPAADAVEKFLAYTVPAEET